MQSETLLSIVWIAACLALQPALIAESERDDRDLLDDVEGDQPHLFLAIVDNTGIFLLVAFLLFFIVYTCFCTV